MSPFAAQETRRRAPLRPAELGEGGPPERLDLQPAIGFMFAGLVSAGLWAIIGLLLWIF